MQLQKELDDKSNLLEENSKQKIDSWLAKFPNDKKQSALIAALFIAQDQNNGFLTEDLVAAVADYLTLPRVSAEEVASFYSMFDQKPVGKHKIRVCTNVSCMLLGAKDIFEHISKKLNIKKNETTEDNKFTLKEVECLGACCGAPMFQIDGKYYENLTIDKVDNILDSLD